MLTLPAAKQSLDYNKNLGDLLEVLKASAIFQFHVFQSMEKPNENYHLKLEYCLEIIKHKQMHHPYLEQKAGLGSLIVVITSDEGFLGELSTALVNAALDIYKSEKDEILVLGESGVKYLEDIGRPFVSQPALSEDLNYSQLEGFRDYLFKNYTGKFSRIMIVYPEFVSLNQQRIETLQLLPYQFPDLGREMRVGTLMSTASLYPYPDQSKILVRLIELHAAFKILQIAQTSKLAEFAAKIMHLEESTQQLDLIKQKESFDYFRLEHTLKDKSIREILASKMMMGKKDE
jgi:ATP synthase F1 gamma subunit